MLDFDEMLYQVGEFGLYQKALFAFQAPFCIFVTFVLFGQLFMSLYPMTIWCNDHFQCTTGNMTPFQRQNFSFPFTMGFLNPCFLNSIDASFIGAVSEMTNRGPCNNTAGPACVNYTQSVNNISTLMQAARMNLGMPGLRPEEFARGYGVGQYGNDYGLVTQPQSTTPRNWGGGQYKYRLGTTSRYQYTVSTDSPGEFDYESMSHDYDIRTTTRRSSGRPGSSGGGTQGGNQGGRSTSRPPFTTTSRSSTQIPGSGRENPAFNPDGTASASRGDRMNQTCRRFVNVALQPGSRIILGEMVNSTHHNGPYRQVETCRNVTFNRTQTGVPYETIVTEGMWWCNAELFVTVSQSVFFLGAIVGGFIIGYIADNYGRVPALVIANLFGAVGGALSVVTTNFYLFTFFRFITGMAFDNCFTMMYILVLEFCGPTYRTLVANLSIAVFYTLGTLILPWLALWIGNWRIYGLAIALPMLLGLLAIFLVPESARWLLSKGRTKEATDILRSFAKVNGKKVDEQVFVDFENDATKLFEEMTLEEEDNSFTAALKTPRLRRTFILLVLIWSLIALVYDGHSRNILNLADENWNLFWMFTIASMTEFPADMLLIFTLDRFGRRWLSFGALTLSGAASIIAATIPPGMRTVGLVMAIISRFFVNVAFNIGLQYAAELLPTVIRAQGVNAIHIMGYVASIISPFVAAIGRTNPALSLIVLGIAAITGGCLSLFLAETLGEDLPNTLEEAEQFGKNQSFWNCPICAKPKDEQVMPMDEDETEVIRRNNLRSSMRGEALRSSIISGSSRASRRRYPNIGLNPSGTPTETTKLRRITH